uniref:RNA helicase n=2 Tax=Lygus hesperus TaxID=30085 RepID=A0A146M3V2_LYGHE
MASYGHDIESSIRTKDVQIDEDVNFSSMLLPEWVLKGLLKAGFKRPSPIQLAAVPLGRCGFDLVVQAKSGTGKTLVFTLVALEMINMEVKRTQVLVAAPTREIAVQIADVIETVAKFRKGLKVGIMIGGTRMETSQAELAKCQVVVGAPGRIRHLIEKEIFDSRAVRLLVLDEADKLMEDVFLKDISYIFHHVAESKQILACSATYSPQLVDFVKKFMKRGMHVTPTGGPSPILVGLRQFVCITPHHLNKFASITKKQETLFRLLSTVQFDQCLVFCNYIVRAETLYGILQTQGWGVACLTSHQAQSDRLAALSKMKEHKARILVTTDLAARGIDASAVNLVINMEVPFSPETYLHRIGRAGRFGNKGLCVTIVSKGEDRRNFQKLISKIGEGDMAVSIIPNDRNVDLWNDEEFDILTGMFEEPEDKVEVDNEIRIEKKVAFECVDEPTEEGEIVDDGLEEGEIVEDASERSKAHFSGKDSSSSGIEVSPRDSPRSGDDSDEPKKAFPSKEPDWKRKYLDDDAPISEFVTSQSVDRVTKDLSNLDLDGKDDRWRPHPHSSTPQHFASSPWRYGHENLWRNGRPQSFFPTPFHHYNHHFNGFHDHPRYPTDSNFYNEPTLRYNPHSRNHHHHSQAPWARNHHWMNHLSSHIDNYIQYARRFHS